MTPAATYARALLLGERARDMRDRAIEAALRECYGNESRAAALLATPLARLKSILRHAPELQALARRLRQPAGIG